MKNIFLILSCFIISIVCSQEKLSNLIIEQDPLIDSLIVKKIAYNKEKIIEAETPKDICHPYPKNGLVPGYKIQLDRFKSKKEADFKVNQFSKMYPNIHALVRYETPNYKVYVGNYFTAKTMETDLRKIRKTFTGAFSVQSNVYVDKDEWNKRYCPSMFKSKLPDINEIDSIGND
ncbi:MAG: SPOR domain-containing protein [Flavobacteriales bacterium]